LGGQVSSIDGPEGMGHPGNNRRAILGTGKPGRTCNARGHQVNQAGARRLFPGSLQNLKMSPMNRATNDFLKKGVISITSFFVLALIINWAVIELFGQKSADRVEHSLIGVILLIAYASLFANKQGTKKAVSFFSLALIPCYFGTVFPDLDITLFCIGGHRNPLFHSGLSFFILLFFVWRRNELLQTLVVGYGVGIASHLWWDIVYYGDVRWIPGGFLDRVWLGANGLLCFISPQKKPLLHEAESDLKAQLQS